MPTRLVSTIKTWSLIIAFLSGIFGAIQAYSILPYRVEQLEKKSDITAQKVETDHDLLIKIYQDVSHIRERLDRNPRNP
jgi:hypothetical protein